MLSLKTATQKEVSEFFKREDKAVKKHKMSWEKEQEARKSERKFKLLGEI